MSIDKSEIRRTLLARRRAVAGTDRQERARRILRRTARLKQFRAGARVAAYVSFGSEVDTQALIRMAFRRGIKLYVPLITDFRRRRMRFAPLSQSGRISKTLSVPARWFNLILIPVVGVDPQGHRLGMGAGFYDRILSFRRLRHRWGGPYLVALAFDCQRAPSVRAQSWDARLDAVITESGLHSFSRTAS